MFRLEYILLRLQQLSCPHVVTILRRGPNGRMGIECFACRRYMGPLNRGSGRTRCAREVAARAR